MSDQPSYSENVDIAGSNRMSRWGVQSSLTTPHTPAPTIHPSRLQQAQPPNKNSSRNRDYQDSERHRNQDHRKQSQHRDSRDPHHQYLRTDDRNENRERNQVPNDDRHSQFSSNSHPKYSRDHSEAYHEGSYDKQKDPYEIGFKQFSIRVDNNKVDLNGHTREAVEALLAGFWGPEDVEVPHYIQIYQPPDAVQHSSNHHRCDKSDKYDREDDRRRVKQEIKQELSPSSDFDEKRERHSKRDDRRSDHRDERRHKDDKYDRPDRDRYDESDDRHDKHSRDSQRRHRDTSQRHRDKYDQYDRDDRRARDREYERDRERRHRDKHAESEHHHDHDRDRSRGRDDKYHNDKYRDRDSHDSHDSHESHDNRDKNDDDLNNKQSTAGLSALERLRVKQKSLEMGRMDDGMAMDDTISSYSTENYNKSMDDQQAEESDDFGPALPPQGVTNTENRQHAIKQTSLGKNLLPGEGEALAMHAKSGQRIPRRGEVGLEPHEIQRFEESGYVMSGSRNEMMNRIRERKEQQIFAAQLAQQEQLQRIEGNVARKEQNTLELLAKLDSQLAKK